MDGGAVGFFLACEDLGENVRPFISRLHFLVFFKVDIRLRALSPLFMPGSVHSGLVN